MSTVFTMVHNILYSLIFYFGFVQRWFRFPEQKWKAAALLGGLEIRRGKIAESRKILADFPEVDALSADVRSLMQGWTDAEARLLTEARQRLEALRSPEADVATFKSSLQRRYGLAGTKADPKVDLWEPWLDLVS